MLVERFHANTDFEALYQAKLSELTAALVDSGVAEELLAARVTVLTEQASELVDVADIDQEADAIAEILTRE
jgi:spore coat protein CotH